MAERIFQTTDDNSDDISLDNLIRQYRDMEARKQEVQKHEVAVSREITSFILQHYDRVLIFERNEAAGEAAFRLLKAEGYNVEWETDREAALEILEGEEFSTLLVSEGFSADGLIIQDQLKKKGIQINLRIIKDFGTAILGHEESTVMKQTRRAFHRLLEQMVRFLESFHPPLVEHSKNIARLSREVAIRMELLPEIVDGVTVAAYLHEIGELIERYRPFWEKSQDIFGDIKINLPELSESDFIQKIQYPYPIGEILKHLQERFDGKGYPDGLKGEEIPIGSRIIAPIDIYMNVVSGTDIGLTMTRGEAIDQLIMDSGSAFDPAVIEILVGVLKQELSSDKGMEYRESILMVDTYDESDLPKIHLQEDGYKVLYASGLKAALSLIESQRPFMVISDIDLQDGDGFQLLEAVRKRSDIREMPFLFLTSRTEKEYIAKSLRAGADDVLPRPCPPDILLAKVARHIARARGSGVTLAVKKGVTGSLRDFGIMDMIQVLAAGMKSAMISVTNGAQEARVALHDGRISYAGLGELEGEEAFYRLIAWEDGEFTIHMNALPPKENIFIKNDMLILEGFRRLDESKRS